MDCSNKCSSNKHLEKPQNRIIQKITQITESYVISVEMTKGLFTWREGAPANRVTRLEGMKQPAFTCNSPKRGSQRAVI